jgi:hypothetical protein
MITILMIMFCAALGGGLLALACYGLAEAAAGREFDGWDRAWAAAGDIADVLHAELITRAERAVA